MTWRPVVDGSRPSASAAAVDLYEKAGVPKKLLRQTRTTHWESHRDNYDELSTQMAGWFAEHLVAAPSIVSERTDPA